MTHSGHFLRSPLTSRRTRSQWGSIRTNCADVARLVNAVEPDRGPRIRRVDHVPVADVDADVMYGARIVQLPGEEHEITRKKLGPLDVLAGVPLLPRGTRDR